MASDVNRRPENIIFARLRGQPPMDKYVLWVVLVLSAVGTLAVYSAIGYLAEVRAAGDTELFLMRHIVRVVLALVALVVFSLVDYHFLARWARITLLGSLALLFLVRVLGVTYGGATRAFHLGPLSVQPSDIAKIALVLYVSVLLVRKQEYIDDFRRAVLPILFWVLVTVMLIGLEDVSTAGLVLMAALLVCFVGRVRVRHLAKLGAVCAVLVVLMLMNSPQRASRLESYLGLDLFAASETTELFSETAEGYQSRQARIAFAMGGLTGRGPGKSVQRDFLPAPYNDLIFAIIAEEYGLLGALALLGLFATLMLRGYLRIARHAPDPLGLFLATGFTTVVTLYGFIHAGVAVGLLPVTGLPLPLVSYGGTSMIAAGVMIGILQNISRQIRQ